MTSPGFRTRPPRGRPPPGAAVGITVAVAGAAGVLAAGLSVGEWIHAVLLIGAVVAAGLAAWTAKGAREGSTPAAQWTVPAVAWTLAVGLCWLVENPLLHSGTAAMRARRTAARMAAEHGCTFRQTKSERTDHAGVEEVTVEGQFVDEGRVEGTARVTIRPGRSLFLVPYRMTESESQWSRGSLPAPAKPGTAPNTAKAKAEASLVSRDVLRAVRPVTGERLIVFNADGKKNDDDFNRAFARMAAIPKEAAAQWAASAVKAVGDDRILRKPSAVDLLVGLLTPV